MPESLVGPLTRFGRQGALNSGSFDCGFDFTKDDTTLNKTKTIISQSVHRFEVGSLVDQMPDFLSGQYETPLYDSRVYFLRTPTFELQEMMISWWKSYLLNNKTLHIVSAAPLPDFALRTQNENYLQIGNTQCILLVDIGD